MILDIEARGFSPRATVIAARTIGSCYQMLFRPDSRPLIGLALFSVMPVGDDFRFEAEMRVLRDGELPAALLDWLEPRVPAEGAILSWDHWWPLPARLAALATAEHPRIQAAAAETEGRWRDLPRAYSWHLKHARATAMPCLCGPGDPGPCGPRLPAALLPDPQVTERTLIDEAMRGWTSWAHGFGDFDDATHPAQRALAAHRAWTAAQPA